MTRFFTAPTATLMVGDGLPDMHVAKAAGVRAAAALWGYTPRADLLATGPDFVLEDPRELL
jgi:phosphoglycolate phosphatase-like HAD superfamily hydrolase